MKFSTRNLLIKNSKKKTLMCAFTTVSLLMLLSCGSGEGQSAGGRVFAFEKYIGFNLEDEDIFFEEVEIYSHIPFEAMSIRLFILDNDDIRKAEAFLTSNETLMGNSSYNSVYGWSRCDSTNIDIVKASVLTPSAFAKYKPASQANEIYSKVYKNLINGENYFLVLKDEEKGYDDFIYVTKLESIVFDKKENFFIVFYSKY